MPWQEDIVKGNSDSIRDHDKIIATLTERLDNIKGDLIRIETSIRDLEARSHELENRLSDTARDGERLEKRFDGLDSRRWDPWMLVLSALVGGLGTLTVQWVAGGLAHPR